MRTQAILRLSLFGYVLFSGIAGVFLAEETLHPGRRVLSGTDETRAREMALRQDSDLADVSASGADGAVLRAWRIRPKHSNERAVILLHGLGDNRYGMTGYAELFLSRGFNVLLPDARAHGSSDGPLATYGLLESEDIRRWFDWMQQNDHPSCIFGFAESMGAAQLLQSLRSEPHFCAVIAESAFSSFREIAYDRVGQFFHTSPWLGRTVLRPVVEIAFVYSAWKYRLYFGQLSPENAVAATAVPVFLIHGHDDSNIPVRHSQRIASRNPAVVLWEVPNADHCGAVGAAPREFSERVIGWLDSHSKRM